MSGYHGNSCTCLLLTNIMTCISCCVQYKHFNICSLCIATHSFRIKVCTGLRYDIIYTMSVLLSVLDLFSHTAEHKLIYISSLCFVPILWDQGSLGWIFIWAMCSALSFAQLDSIKINPCILKSTKSSFIL